MEKRTTILQIANSLATAICPFIVEPTSAARAVEITRDKADERDAPSVMVFMDAFAHGLREKCKSAPVTRKGKRKNTANNNDERAVMDAIARGMNDGS